LNKGKDSISDFQFILKLQNNKNILNKKQKYISVNRDSVEVKERDLEEEIEMKKKQIQKEKDKQKKANHYVCLINTENKEIKKKEEEKKIEKKHEKCRHK
jgi:hypothetical protein